MDFKLLLIYISMMAKGAESSSHLLATSSFTFELFIPSLAQVLHSLNEWLGNIGIQFLNTFNSLDTNPVGAV